MDDRQHSENPDNLATDLDGSYAVHTVSDYDGPLPKRSDGQTRIENGRTHRLDDAGCEWNSTFIWADEDKSSVTMISVADPANAAPDFLLIRPDGSPTSDPVTYRAELKVMRKDDRVQLTGTINDGAQTVFITMRRIGD